MEEVIVMDVIHTNVHTKKSIVTREYTQIGNFRVTIIDRVLTLDFVDENYPTYGKDYPTPTFEAMDNSIMCEFKSIATRIEKVTEECSSAMWKFRNTRHQFVGDCSETMCFLFNCCEHPVKSNSRDRKE